jgi:molecular chaperone DnaK
MGAERRQHARVQLNMLVQFRLHDIEEFFREWASNISGGGMFIRSREPHAVGSMIYLQFHLYDGSKLIEGLGKVVHVNPPDHAVPGMGVEFVNLDRESKTLIDQIIAERAKELGDSGDSAEP